VICETDVLLDQTRIKVKHNIVNVYFVNSLTEINFHMILIALVGYFC